MKQNDSSRLNGLATLVEKLAEAPDANAMFVALALEANTQIGHRLFTIMAFDAENRQVRRLYSSNPEAYPPGGIKSKRDTPWAQQVLDQGKPYVGSEADDIRAHFTDYELIAKLGLASVLNMPIRLTGRTLGTMNLLHEARYYESHHLEPARVLAGLLGAPLLLSNSFESSS